MPFNADLKNIEIHNHLDGSVRPQTIWELSQKKKVNLNFTTFDEFHQTLLPKQPYTLTNYLKGYDLIVPVIAGDKEALARISTECVEDCATRGKLFYVELRFAPHLLTGPGLDAEAVTKTVLDAVNRAGKQNGLEVRLILCMMRHKPDTANDIVQLAVNFKPHGVVGVDLAGDDRGWKGTSPKIIEAFQSAKKLGIHRTVHAGENGPAEAVIEAIEEMHAERIGHGYHILDKPELYEIVRQRNVHFEVCPTSSLRTGAVTLTNGRKHPVVQFAEDKIPFSINTDGHTMTESWVPQELEFCVKKLGLSSQAVKQSKYNLKDGIFLDGEEKTEIINHLLQVA
ncbi:unnamed protein product [Calicophoron daubneyi]|uniref:adenosine deaminase n=1 Tax=Calicophoron daubneyi TaxID=300641 RepID=A0AAV2U1L9_CALDB